MKKILYLGVIAALVFYFGYSSIQADKAKEARLATYKAKLEASRAQEEACLKNPSCLDNRAKKLSKDEKRVVHSATGNSFLYGEFCISKCSDFIAGYDWADKRGISKEYGCSEHIGLFGEGCLGYIEDRKDELSSDNDPHYENFLEEPEPEFDCRPGRFRDC